MYQQKSMKHRSWPSQYLTLILVVGLTGSLTATAQEQIDDLLYIEENNQIRRDKFDLVLPQVMRERDIDMWIHVVREAIPDSFAAEELGSTSGVIIFTDRGGDKIERAVVGRRWGAAQRDRVVSAAGDPVKALKAYDIVTEAVRVQEPVSGPVTEYDLRFDALKQFVETRDPKRIALNFLHELGQWPTFRGAQDGLSHTDYLLLAEELGEKYADRIVSSEYVMTDYIMRKVPSEISLLKKMRKADIAHTLKVFDAIEPGVSKARNREVAVFRRMTTGESQRGRSKAWENAVIERGDVLVQPILGMYAYVLREGESEPPAEIQKLWAEYLKIDKILADTIKAGQTPNEIIENYTGKFAEAGIIVRDDQLHMIVPKNDFPVYSADYPAGKTHLSIDSHAQMKGARRYSDETYYSPRIGSYGPDWVKNIPLPMNHHFVIEYFFYMPSAAAEGQDQYLLWWDHEEAIATPNGVEYLSPPQKELYLIH